MRGDNENQVPLRDVSGHENLIAVDRAWGNPLCQKIANILSEVSVEPSLFLVMFGYGLHNVIAQVTGMNYLRK